MASVVLSDKKKYVNPSYRSGANPLWGKKKHSLLIDSQGASNKTIRTESGTLKFENGVAALPNDERAKDIYDEIKKTHALHPNQYSLVENKQTVNTDEIHRYTFGWNRSYERAWERTFGRIKNDPEIEEDTDGRRTEQRTGVDDSEHRTGQL